MLLARAWLVVEVGWLDVGGALVKSERAGTVSHRALHVPTHPHHAPTQGDGNGAGGGGFAPGMRRRGGGFHQGGVDPEDIFNMFFGGGMHGGAFHHQRQQQRQQRARQGQHQDQQHGGDGLNIQGIWQLFPLLMLFMLTMFNGFPAATQASLPFSLAAHGTYHVPMTTRDNIRGIRGGIPYFVQDDFKVKHSRDRRNVEAQVQQSFHDELHSECSHQRNTQKRMLYKAKTQRRKSDRDSLLAQANALDTSACDQYQRWFS